MSLTSFLIKKKKNYKKFYKGKNNAKFFIKKVNFNKTNFKKPYFKKPNFKKLNLKKPNLKKPNLKKPNLKILNKIKLFNKFYFKNYVNKDKKKKLLLYNIIKPFFNNFKNIEQYDFIRYKK